MKHEDVTHQNQIAWESQSYEAWVSAYGTPDSAAAELVRDPRRKLRRILPYLTRLKGQKISNPLGSHGRVAVSLALLGAEVTVFDISATNKRYAVELAQAAGVNIEYRVGDFLKLAEVQDEQFDQIVMELGVVHYFRNLNGFVCALAAILKSKGTVILNEFHPLFKKAISIDEEGITLSGDYFATDMEIAEVPFKAILKDQVLPTCIVRRWNLGEIITAFAENGFRLTKLVEEPSWDIAQLPGTFTLVATSIESH